MYPLHHFSVYEHPLMKCIALLAAAIVECLLALHSETFFLSSVDSLSWKSILKILFFVRFYGM